MGMLALQHLLRRNQQRIAIRPHGRGSHGRPTDGSAEQGEEQARNPPNLGRFHFWMRLLRRVAIVVVTVAVGAHALTHAAAGAHVALDVDA